MKILVFAPHAHIWKHAFPEAILVESLMKRGHEVIYITCSGVFSHHCIPMISNHIPYDAPLEVKNKICKECKANANLIVNSFHFPHSDLDFFLAYDDMLKIKDILKKTTKENFSKIIIDNIKIGEIASYQVLLRYKQSKSNQFSDKAWQEYLNQLNVSLTAFFALKKIFLNYNPDRIIQYSGLYSVNSICRKIAENNKIPAYYLHAGINQRDRLQNLIIAKNHTFEYIKSLFDSWENLYKDIPCSSDSIYKVTDNFIDIIKSKSFLSYSKSKANQFDIRKRFNIPSDKKIIVAIMSSYDEHLAAESVGAYRNNIIPIFKTQIEWIKTLINFFEKRDDLFLIIRLHPREFPTNREKNSAIKSEHSKNIENEFRNLPKNVVINWPTDLVSFYDLLEETNLFLNAFSTAAREISMLGLPVLTYNNEDVLEPVSTNYKGDTIQEYLELIDDLLNHRFDIDRIKKAYRWRSLEQVYSHISIAESFYEKDDLLSFYQKVDLKIKRTIGRLIPLWLEKKQVHSRSNTLNDANLIEDILYKNEANVSNLRNFSDNQIIDENKEIDLIKSEIKRIIKYLYPKGSMKSKPNTLRYFLEYLVNS